MKPKSERRYYRAIRETPNSYEELKIKKGNYTYNGEPISKERFNQIENKWEREDYQRDNPFLSPDKDHEFAELHVPGIGEFNNYDLRCPEGYHWVQTYEKHRNLGIYKSQVVRGHCSRDPQRRQN